MAMHSIKLQSTESVMPGMTMPLDNDTILALVGDHVVMPAAQIETQLMVAQRLIEAQQRRIMQLENLALTDELTGLVNRRAFMQALRQELAAADRDEGAAGMVVLCDLNGFKQINDLHGHNAGDAYLQSVAVALQTDVRPSDLVARLGGDEFAVLLRRINSVDGAKRLQRVDESFHGRALNWHGHKLPLRASFGAAVFGKGDQPEELLEQADQLLYLQKACRRSDR